MKKSFFLLILMFFLTACVQREIKEGQVYIIQDKNLYQEDLEDLVNIQGRIPFQEHINYSSLELEDKSQVLLTITPNSEEIYIMEKIKSQDFPKVIKGEGGQGVRILRQNINTKEESVVVENIPFVSKTSWNLDASKLAFKGGGRLTIYDVENRTILMEEELNQAVISNFFWSPMDANKIYTEEIELVNAGIYYLSSQRKVEAYETREETYFKGKLDHNYYYGTKWDLVDGNIKTVIMDKQGKVIKDLTTGRFRDAYQKSLLVVGENGFGLYYIRDISNFQEVITLSEEYIYDVKFVVDGKIVYTTKVDDIEENLFNLHIVNNNGREVKKFKVHGGSIGVLPDGRRGYVSGEKWVKVNFVENILEENQLSLSVENEDLEEIYRSIRGAIKILYDFEIKGQANWRDMKKYFKNTQNPQQWAYFDVERIFNEKINRSFSEKYAMEIELKDLKIMEEDNRASAIIGVNVKNLYGRNIVMNYAIELVEEEKNWYVTGFSTFPYSKEREEIERLLEEILPKIQEGSLFRGKLQGSSIMVGQLQFWISNIPHLALNPEAANAVKVFLQANYQGKEEIYKLVLEKINQNDWKPVTLTKENLSGL